jgi:phage FluMu gp28-like protein
MYHDSGLCGFLKGADRIYNKKASLCEDLKFTMYLNSKEQEHVRLPKHKLILARLKQIEWWNGFPDISEYKGYKNS